MNVAMVMLALFLPAACGYGLWQWLLGRPRGCFAQCAAIGTGYLAGAVGFGWVLTWFDGVATHTLFGSVAVWLAPVAIAIGATGVRWAPDLIGATRAAQPSSAQERWIIGLTVVLLALTGLLILQQAIALPSLSWDAWNAWLAKSKAWYYVGSFVEAQSLEAWRDAPAGTSITTTAWIYPEALPRFAVWLASASGGWNEWAVHAAWPLAWAALGLACFGYLGLAGCRTLPALLTAAAILTLPLITAHAALAGYADLWLAALLMIVGFHLLRWFQHRSWRDALAAVLLAGLLLAVKLEGAVWLACLVAAVGLALLPPRWRWGVLLAGPLLFAVALPFGGLRLPLPGLGVVRFDWGLIEIPTHGAMNLTWRPVLDEVMQALFLLPNWSLLWYVAPIVLVLRWRALRSERELKALGGFLALGYSFLFVLFFLTDASAWAENFTSINRVLMQIVPITVVWLSLLWAAPTRLDPVPRDRSPSTAG